MAHPDKKTLFLHIGLHKTGSTALQFFLNNNAARLEQADLYYPPFQMGSFAGGTCGNAQQLALALRQNTLDECRKFVDAVANAPCSRVLLSCELLDLLATDDIKRLRDLFAPFTCRILVYLRREDQLATSLINQMVSFNIKTDFHYDVRHMTESVLRYAEVFGQDAMCVRVYEKRQFTGGSIFSDFLSVFGLPLDEGYILPPQANPPMGRDYLELKRLCNELPCSLHMSREVIYPVLSRLSEQFDHRQVFATPPLLSPAEQAAIVDEYRDFNTHVAKTFLGRDTLFLDPDPDPATAWQPYPGVPVEALARAMFAFTLEQARRHKEQTCMHLLNHKRLAVWGIGERYHDHVAPLLRDFAPDARQVCLVDDNPVLQGSLVNGIPVTASDALNAQDIDAVVIATLHEDNVRNRLRELGLRLPTYLL